MNRILWALGFVLLFSLPALAWNEPEGFRGVPWESSEQVVKEKFGGPCVDLEKSQTILGERACSTIVTVGDVETKALFSFRTNKLIGVVLTFDENKFHLMRGTFVERYGKPSSSREVQAQTAIGARYVNQILEWKGDKIHISLHRYGSTVKESSAIFIVNSDLKEVEKAQQKQQKKGADDL